MIRSLVFASIEYILCAVVLLKGKLYPRVVSAILFFLASYQLGELILFSTDGQPIGIQVAYFSTTLLPPLGVLLIEKISGRKFGFPFFMGAGVFFAVMFVLFPDMVTVLGLTSCCVRVASRGDTIYRLWSFYYSGTLVYSLLIMLISALRAKDILIRTILAWLFVSYLSFYFVSILIVRMYPDNRQSFASMMCALAIATAVIISTLSLTVKLPPAKSKPLKKKK